MFEKKKLKTWSVSYWNQISRNIGLLKISEQEILRKAPIAILGIGGLGGPLVEQLVRTGFESITICDNEKFEESNLNRQLCTKKDIGKFKVDIVEKILDKINPDIQINKFYKVNEKNISEVLKNISVVALTLDDPLTSIIISRECFNKKIPLLESWAIPYLCAWWFTPLSINYETCYEFNTQNMTIEEIRQSEETLLNLKKALLSKLLLFPNIKERFDRENGTVDALLSGNIPSISLAPIVRMTASYLSFEIIYSGILNLKSMVLAPKIIGYDYFRMLPFEIDFSNK